jgi:hypothetical protein
MVVISMPGSNDICSRFVILAMSRLPIHSDGSYFGVSDTNRLNFSLRKEIYG